MENKHYRTVAVNCTDINNLKHIEDILNQQDEIHIDEILTIRAILAQYKVAKDID